MASKSYGRIWFALAACFAVGFLWLRCYDQEYSYLPFGFSKYTPSANKHIGNATLGFQKIFVINAPWRPDRKDTVSLAGSYTGISFDWIEGADPRNMSEKAYPPGYQRTLSDGLKGCWRAHMNALREVVEQNLTTALIMEDDADWDFRIRTQLSDISAGVRHIPNLIIEAEKQTAKHAVIPEDQEMSKVELAKRSSRSITTLPSHAAPKDDPYGRNWDILWLGHCGADLPPASPHSPNRVIIPNDATVPEPRYLKPMAHAHLDSMGTLYPPHTRVIHQANKTICATGYAVTQAGARKILYEFGIREWTHGYDFALSDFCNGVTRAQKQDDAPMPRCLVVQPPVFGHHFTEKAGSDITGVGIGGKPERETRYVRWSVMMNLERLVKGEEGIIEQWPDVEK